MSPESKPPASTAPNRVLGHEQLTDLISLADDIVTNQPHDSEGDPANKDEYMEWSTELVTGADGTRYYLARNYEDPEGAVIVIGVGEDEDGISKDYLTLYLDGTYDIKDNRNNRVESSSDGNSTVNMDNAGEFARGFLERMKEEKGLLEQKREEDKRLASIAEEGNFSQLLDVDHETSERVLAQVSFMGQEFGGRLLTPDLVIKMGLTPKHVQQVTDRLRCYFSPAYSLNGRLAVLAITEHDEQLVARTFYLSDSQNVWRYLPAYGKKDNPGWINKGRNENSLNLPLELQRSLGSIGSHLIKPAIEDAELAFYGTAGNKPREHETDYIEPVNPTTNEYAISPMFGLDSVTKDGHRPVEEGPVDLAYTPEFESKYPDFSGASEEWVTNNRMYGDVKALVIPSKDGTWNYLFFTDKIGRTWIGQVDIADSPISQTTLRTKYFSVGLMTTPANEYKSSVGEYGGAEFGSYVDVYDRFLSRLPIIRDFQQSVKQEGHVDER